MLWPALTPLLSWFVLLSSPRNSSITRKANAMLITTFRRRCTQSVHMYHSQSHRWVTYTYTYTYTHTHKRKHIYELFLSFAWDMKLTIQFAHLTWSSSISKPITTTRMMPYICPAVINSPDGRASPIGNATCVAK